MGVLELFLFFAACKSALSAREPLLEPCQIADMNCLNISTTTFLEKTYAGIPEYDVKPLDPLVISELTYAVPDTDYTFNFKNLTVTGLQNQIFSDFKMDRAKKSVMLQTRLNANIVGDLTIEIKKLSKSFSGTYYAKTTGLATARYNYVLTPKNRVEYFIVGPATITCMTLGNPEVTLDPKLAKLIAQDPDARSRKDDYYKRAVDLRKNLMSIILAEAYVTMVHNIRALTKMYPKSAFFKDI